MVKNVLYNQHPKQFFNDYIYSNNSIYSRIIGKIKNIKKNPFNGFSNYKHIMVNFSDIKPKNSNQSLKNCLYSIVNVTNIVSVKHPDY